MSEAMRGENDWLARRFESHRGHLRGVAYRMLGSFGEAEDAVQEAWLRLSRSASGEIENLGGWLTTTVARVCLDMLRARAARREESFGSRPREEAAHAADAPEGPIERTAPELSARTPEQEAILADSVGLALLVVLDALEPAERVSFVLHDLFGVPFADIAAVVGRTPAAARQLASRARRRVRGRAATPQADLARQREVVGAFLAASQRGDFEALLAVLDPNVELRPDLARPLGGPREIVRGASAVAKLFSGRAQAARAALVNGSVGILVAPRGKLLLALSVTITQGRIARIEVIAEPARLGALELAALSEEPGSNPP